MLSRPLVLQCIQPCLHLLAIAAISLSMTFQGVRDINALSCELGERHHEPGVPRYE